jgi:hypothetical protein
MKVRTKYVAFDGVSFNSEAECRAYEAKLAHVRLVNLTIEQIEAALSGTDPDLADAIEQIGTRIGRARRERGELRHQRKAKDEAPTQQITGPEASADEGRTSDFSSQNEGEAA